MLAGHGMDIPKVDSGSVLRRNRHIVRKERTKACDKAAKISRLLTLDPLRVEFDAAIGRRHHADSVWQTFVCLGAIVPENPGESAAE